MFLEQRIHNYLLSKLNEKTKAFYSIKTLLKKKKTNPEPHHCKFKIRLFIAFLLLFFMYFLCLLRLKAFNLTIPVVFKAWHLFKFPGLVCQLYRKQVQFTIKNMIQLFECYVNNKVVIKITYIILNSIEIVTFRIPPRAGGVSVQEKAGSRVLIRGMVNEVQHIPVFLGCSLVQSYWDY